MTKFSPDSSAKPRLGVDPWGKSNLAGGEGPLPRSATFLCTLEVHPGLEPVDVDFFVNRTQHGELEIWYNPFGRQHKLLSRTLVSSLKTGELEYVDELFEICRHWLGFQRPQELLQPGLFGPTHWLKLKRLLDSEWRQTGKARTQVIQAQIAGHRARHAANRKKPR